MVVCRRLDWTTPEDEVSRLARTFNEMWDRLEGSFQRRFTGDASHELRTPLAVIWGEIEVALERPRTPAEYAETLESVGVEAQRMSRLVNELLLLARADADELHCGPGGEWSLSQSSTISQRTFSTCTFSIT